MRIVDCKGPRHIGQCGLFESFTSSRHSSQPHMWPQGITAVVAGFSKQRTHMPSSSSHALSSAAEEDGWVQLSSAGAADSLLSSTILASAATGSLSCAFPGGESSSSSSSSSAACDQSKPNWGAGSSRASSVAMAGCSSLGAAGSSSTGRGWPHAMHCRSAAFASRCRRVHLLHVHGSLGGISASSATVPTTGGGSAASVVSGSCLVCTAASASGGCSGLGLLASHTAQEESFCSSSATCRYVHCKQLHGPGGHGYGSAGGGGRSADADEADGSRSDGDCTTPSWSSGDGLGFPHILQVARRASFPSCRYVHCLQLQGGAATSIEVAAEPAPVEVATELLASAPDGPSTSSAGALGAMTVPITAGIKVLGGFLAAPGCHPLAAVCGSWKIAITRLRSSADSKRKEYSVTTGLAPGTPCPARNLTLIPYCRVLLTMFWRVLRVLPPQSALMVVSTPGSSSCLTSISCLDKSSLQSECSQFVDGMFGASSFASYKAI
mmetsp:Transcript_9389/g.17000  ORF Transcript_9389/g.17000 Transcript_9389/m.17000 type:complete len:495 (+) Transcript_9389:61-1545(+)